MAVHKVCGIETEFGILHRNPDGDSNPVSASSMLINAFVNDRLDGRIGWDFEDESPANDARGFNEFDALAPEIETHLINAVLTNGARYYVDHAHPEMSSPECYDPREAVVYDVASERILQASMAVAARLLPAGQELIVHKNNSDGKGNSYGTHENYLMDRNTPFGRIVSNITPFFITRQLFTGSGKVGSEAPGLGIAEVPFQLTQRADFFEEEVGLETTLKRPIVNTRDEPHANSRRYRRLHVINADATQAEVATYLKVGTTAIVLAMIDDDVLPRDVQFRHPVPAMRHVSYDLTLTETHEMLTGGRMTALEVQWEYLDLARKYAEERGLDVVGGEDVGLDILERWEQILTGLETDPMSLAGQLEWVAKLRLLRGFMDRHDCGWDDPRIAALALQYHDLRPDKNLHQRLGMERITTDAEVEHAVMNPPTRTRAYFRGRCLDKFKDQIVAANWDSLVFDVGTDPLRRVPMLEPLRGTEAHVGNLLDTCDSVAELLDQLGA
ncbi:MAG: depupylase/deamidase Dop [Acidimicrobiales bacterium]|nr:proteasome accessory factor PafA2 [Acidimicrobiales bacterium]